MRSPLQLADPLGLLLLGILVWIYLRSRGATNAGSQHLWIRFTVVFLLVLAISGFGVMARPGDHSVVFALDVSDSLSEEQREEGLAWIERAVSSMKSADQAGLVVFGSEALVERPLGGSLRLDTTRSVVAGGGTNLAAALSLAAAQLEGRAHPKIVLLSDGNQNIGDALEAASTAAADGIPVDVVPLPGRPSASSNEVLIAKVAAPSRVKTGAPFEIIVDVVGQSGLPLALRLESDGRPVAERGVTLEAEESRFRFTRTAGEPGLHEFLATLESGADTLSANNRGAVAVHVTGPPMIGCLCRDETAPHLIGILARRGFAVETLEPAEVTAARLKRYDALLMSNIPAARLTDDQLLAMADFVETRGGGLLMTGSVGSFGPGGYAGTPIERVLPVELEVRDNETAPTLALVLILDKSGSMAANDQGASKLERAKEAAISVLDHLGPGDFFGIIAFDRDPHAVVELQSGIDAKRVDRLLEPFEPGGGTAIEAAVEAAHGWLAPARVEKKHALLLSDGQGDPAGLQHLEGLLADSGIVVSAVAIGEDVDRDYLEALAQGTGGRTYFAASAGELTEIFARETLRIAGEWLIERRVRPLAASSHPILDGIDTASMPEILGYVSSTLRPRAQTVLTAEADRPLLAAWRSGIGRTAVLTTDLFSSWSEDLSSWDQFDKLWVQAVRWVSRRLTSESLEPSVTIVGNVGRIVVDAFDRKHSFANSARIETHVQAPDGASETILLAQTGPGRYEGAFAIGARGLYRLRISGTGGGLAEDATLLLGVDAWTLPEYKRIGANLSLLREIARRSQGSVLGPDDSPFDRDDSAVGYRDLSQFAGTAALLVFLADVVYRRRQRSAAPLARTV